MTTPIMMIMKTKTTERLAKGAQESATDWIPKRPRQAPTAMAVTPMGRASNVQRMTMGTSTAR
jgi:hypothetical protein